MTTAGNDPTPEPDTRPGRPHDGDTFASRLPSWAFNPPPELDFLAYQAALAATQVRGVGRPFPIPPSQAKKCRDQEPPMILVLPLLACHVVLAEVVLEPGRPPHKVADDLSRHIAQVVGPPVEVVLVRRPPRPRPG